MDAKLAMDTFENVMGLAIEGCRAIATYIRGVHNFLFLFHYSGLQLSVIRGVSLPSEGFTWLISH
jgi:exosome complex component RRP41